MKTLTRIVILLCLFLTSACEDDPAQPNGGTQPSFEPLTTREAVLHNFELAWNQRRDDKFSELLDSGFRFYFSPEDILNGSPVQWDFATEVTAVHEWFVSNNAPVHEGPRCSNIRVDLVLDELVWVEVPAQWGGPEDVWYKATVPYAFMFQMEPSTTFIAPSGAMAELTVMPAGDEWRLVEWSDFAYGASTSDRGVSSASEPSWGAVKRLYQPTFLQPLTRDAVIKNLEAAWNERRADKLDELLDSEFTFYFSAGDVSSGAPESWARAQEYATSSALFTSNQQSTTDFPVCESLDVDLVMPANLIWVEIVPEEFPSEKWYVTTVSYDCVFELVPNTTYITAPGAKAQFTVRAGGDQWRLVEWRDLGSAASEMAFGSEIAWGAVKLLYQ